MSARHNGTERSEGGQTYWTGLGLAVCLTVALLVITLFQTLSTFVIRLYEADVMLGVLGNVGLDSRLVMDVALFAIGVLAVHGLFALAVHALAVLTGGAWPAARQARRGLVVAWFALALGAILLVNAQWFPRSHSGSYYADVARRGFGSVSISELAVTLFGGMAATVIAVSIGRLLSKAAAARYRAPVIQVSAIVMLGVVAVAVSRGAPRAQAVQGRTNIVILGLDSLRLEELKRFGGRGWTPNIDSFLQTADLFPDSITPLGRTFPSWVAILTGRSPRSTGAIFNLVRREDVSASPTIADTLAAKGYKTVFATDEVRFSNIDESYGFGQLITPPIGAADFLIGQAGDLPLSNVVAGTALGRTLLRYLHANRGVAFLYRPASFISRLRDELPAEEPVLVAIHLTAAHWPYFHSDTPLNLHEQITDAANPEYREALQTADRMFGEVVEVLADKGVLDDAVVVVLSDHGEALGTRADSLLGSNAGQVAGVRVPIPVLNWGHGQSVLSPVQYQVLLAFRGFGPHVSLGKKGRDLPQPVTLEDVVPTVLDLLDEQGPEVDGMSLAPMLREASVAQPTEESRVRFTETDIRVTPSEDGDLDGADAAKQAARLFEIDKTSGWLHLRPAAIERLKMMKERAALDEARLIAVMPVAPDQQQYLLVDRTSGLGRVLTERPDSGDPDAQKLWDELHAHFGAELKPPVVVTPGIESELLARWAALPAMIQGPGH